MTRILVAGAGGFVGGHLTRALLEQGHDVVAVDRKPLEDWWQAHEGADVYDLIDLRELENCRDAVVDVEHVYNLATDMGGIGYLSSHRLEPMRSVLINTHLLTAAAELGVERYLFASSACVYGEGLDTAEANAYPAAPEDGYGWEKLFSERMCRHFTDEAGLPTRVARLHNVYGPYGSWNDGREKAPAAICRKVAEAIESGNPVVPIWGSGRQRRSFLWIDDAVERLQTVMAGGQSEPVNVGSAELVTIDDLARIVIAVAGHECEIVPTGDGPTGVAGRTSDNREFELRYGRCRQTSLRAGLEQTYPWIAEQVGRARVAL